MENKSNGKLVVLWTDARMWRSWREIDARFCINCIYSRVCLCLPAAMEVAYCCYISFFVNTVLVEQLLLKPMQLGLVESFRDRLVESFRDGLVVW